MKKLNRKELAQAEKLITIELDRINGMADELGIELVYRSLADVRTILRVYIEKDLGLVVINDFINRTSKRVSNGHPRIEKMVKEYTFNFGMLLALEKHYNDMRKVG